MCVHAQASRSCGLRWFCAFSFSEFACTTCLGTACLCFLRCVSSGPVGTHSACACQIFIVSIGRSFVVEHVFWCSAASSAEVHPKSFLPVGHECPSYVDGAEQ